MNMNRKANFEFSRAGHQLAVKHIYPVIFLNFISAKNIGDYEYEHEKVKMIPEKYYAEFGENQIKEIQKSLEEREKEDVIKRCGEKKFYDRELSIDVLLELLVSLEGLKDNNMTVTIQEKTSRDYRDNIVLGVLTRDGKIGEFYKFGCQHLLFMVIKEGELKHWLFLPWAGRMVEGILKGTIPYNIIPCYEHNELTLIGVKMDILRENFPDIIEWWSPDTI